MYFTLQFNFLAAAGTFITGMTGQVFQLKRVF